MLWCTLLIYRILLSLCLYLSALVYAIDSKLNCVRLNSRKLKQNTYYFNPLILILSFAKPFLQ
jgi:hypothetical protein